MRELARLARTMALPEAAFVAVVKDAVTDDEARWFNLWLVHVKGLNPATGRRLASQARRGSEAPSWAAWVDASPDSHTRAQRAYLRRLWEQWQGARS